MSDLQCLTDQLLQFPGAISARLSAIPDMSLRFVRYGSKRQVLRSDFCLIWRDRQSREVVMSIRINVALDGRGEMSMAVLIIM